MSKLFVGGLPWSASEHTLKEVFCKYGTVEDVKIITDRETGKSKGFGFITFDNQHSATAAKNEMNGQEIDGRVITVDEAREKPRNRGDRQHRQW